MPRPLLLLLPGLLCDRAVWAAQLDALAPLADIVVPEYHDDPSLGAMAERALAAAGDAPRIAAAGHSMGGRIAFELWRRAPRALRNVSFLEQPRTNGVGQKRVTATGSSTESYSLRQP